MAEKVIIPVEAQTEKANAELKKTKKEIDNTKKSTEDLSGTFDRLTGGMVSGFKAGVTAVKTTITALKGLKSAIAATGLGLLVITIAALAQAFRNSEEGQNRLNKIMGVTGSIVGNLVDLLADFGDLIIRVFTEPQKVIQDFGNSIKNFVTNQFDLILKGLGLLGTAIKKTFEGDFKGAIEAASDGFKTLVVDANPAVQAVKGLTNATADFGKQLSEEAKLAANVADMRAKADKIERKLIVERSTLEAKIAELRLKARLEDEFTAAQRRSFLLESQKLEEQLLEQEKEALSLRSEAISLENTFARSNKKNLDEEAQAKAALNNIEAQRLTQQRATQRELNRLNKEIQRQAEEAEKQEEERQKSVLAGNKEYNDQLRKLRISQIADEEEKQRKLLEIELEGIREKYGKNTELEKELLAKFNDEIQENKKAIDAENEQKRIAEETLALENELLRLDENSFLRLDKQAEILERERRLKLDNDKLTAAERERIEIEYNKQVDDLANARIEIAQREADAKKAAETGIIEQSAAAIGAIANLAGNNKELAIAAATVETYLAAQKAYTSQLIPGDPTSPIRGALAATAAIASGIANVRQIASVSIPGGGGGGGSASGAGGGNSFDAVTQQRFDAFQQNTQAPQNVRDVTDRDPVQAFVLEGDVTNSQSTISRLRQRQRI